jgi:hypothetical protein
MQSRSTSRASVLCLVACSFLALSTTPATAQKARAELGQSNTKTGAFVAGNGSTYDLEVHTSIQGMNGTPAQWARYGPANTAINPPALAAFAAGSGNWVRTWGAGKYIPSDGLAATLAKDFSWHTPPMGAPAIALPLQHEVMSTAALPENAGSIWARASHDVRTQGNPPASKWTLVAQAAIGTPFMAAAAKRAAAVAWDPLQFQAGHQINGYAPEIPLLVLECSDASMGFETCALAGDQAQSNSSIWELRLSCEGLLTSASALQIEFDIDPAYFPGIPQGGVALDAYGLGVEEALRAALAYDGATYTLALTSTHTLFTADLVFPSALTYVEGCGTAVRSTESVVTAYCTPGVSTNGCAATLSALGTPSASAASGFTVTANDVEGQRPGMFFYGVTGPAAFSWNGSSFLCVKSPTQRIASQASGGLANTCSGSMSYDWNAYMSSHPFALGNPRAPGMTVNTQLWYRDPPAPKTTNFSDALQFVVQP